MTAREIHDSAIEAARDSSRIETLFYQRKIKGNRQLHSGKTDDQDNQNVLIVRVTCVPLTPVFVEDLTLRHSLWWPAIMPEVKVNEKLLHQNYHSNDFPSVPRIGIRCFESSTQTRVERTLNADGVAEIRLIRKFIDHKYEFKTFDNGRIEKLHLSINALIELFVGALAQVRHFRANIGRESTEYVVEVHIIGKYPVELGFPGDRFAYTFQLDEQGSLFDIPRYYIGSGDTYFDTALTYFRRDIINACGIRSEDNLILNWK